MRQMTKMSQRKQAVLT